MGVGSVVSDGRNNSDSNDSNDSNVNSGNSNPPTFSDDFSSVPGRGRNFDVDKNKSKMSMSNVGNQLMNNSPLGNTKGGQAAQTAMKIANTATKIAVKAKGLVASTISTLMNPITWVILLVAAIVLSTIVGVFSFVQTIGKTDNADGCYGVGASNSSTIVFHDDDSDMDRANKMATWLISQPAWEVNDGKPLTKEQAFAIVGNFMAESRMEPHTIEVSAPNWEQYMGADNDVIWQWTRDLHAQGTNVGLGLAQWTWNPGRAEALINKARETNTKWFEIQPQLELIKDEMNGSYANPLKNGGFADSGKSIEELSVIFHDIYEGSADNSEMKKRRGDAAKEIAQKYIGGSATGGRSGGSCTRGSSADMSSSIALAISIAYRPDEAHKGVTADEKGRNVAKPEYIEAKEMIMATYPDTHLGGELYASCDRVVATIVKNTLDPEFSWGGVSTIDEYFIGNPEKWEQIKTAEEVEPGDVFILNQGPGREHLAFYIGDYEGTDSIVQGSWNTEVAIIKNAYMKAEMTSGYKAYRFIGDAVRTDLAALD